MWVGQKMQIIINETFNRYWRQFSGSLFVTPNFMFLMVKINLWHKKLECGANLTHSIIVVYKKRYANEKDIVLVAELHWNTNKLNLSSASFEVN